MKKISLLALGVVSAFALQAQDYQDALRCSESFVEGNARYMAMGGALSSLGGNVGALSVNPASSASFKKSVIEFTPTYIYTKSEDYYINYDKAITNTLKVPSFGLVGYKQLKQNDVFVSGISFGFAMNANNRYDETIKYNGYNKSSSLSDDFLRLAREGVLNEDYGQLAESVYVLGCDGKGTPSETYFTDFVPVTGPSTYGQYQDFKIDRSGVKREMLFNIGVNFSEYVFFGADLSFTNLYYQETKMLTEIDKPAPGKFDELGDYTYKTDLDVTGSAVGGKFGIIGRPIEYLRIGAAVHTPIVYSFSEDYVATMDSYWDVDPIDNSRKNTDYTANKPYRNDYNIAQPMKLVGSLGFVYKNVLNVGVDIETMDYSQCELRSNYSTMSDENAQLVAELQSVTNLKCGGEFRYGPFLFRAGYATYGNPYKNVKDNFYRNDFSLGFGLATNAFYYDLGYVRAKSKQYNTLYTNLDNKDVEGKSTIKRDYVMFTAGFKF